MNRASRIETSVIYYVKDILHNAECNTIDQDYQPNTYRDEVPYYVKVVEGWPDSRDDIYLPTVSISSQQRDDRGLQIGGGHYVRNLMFIEIFANHDEERNFLKTTLFEALVDKSDYLRDFDDGFPYYQIISGESTISKYWPSGIATADSELWFENVNIRDIPPMYTTGEVDNHRAQISFTAVSIR